MGFREIKWMESISKTYPENYIVSKITEEIRDQLADIGIILGAEISILGRAPFSGPFLVQIGRSVFALRPEELNGLTLEKVD